MIALKKEEYLSIYEKMPRIRTFEETAAALAGSGELDKRKPHRREEK